MLDKAALLATALPEAEVEIPGKGTVRVRGLTRAEALRLFNPEPGADLVMIDVEGLVCGLIDPKLTAAEAKAWVESAPPAEVAAVANKIVELTGLDGKGARFHNGQSADAGR